MPPTIKMKIILWSIIFALVLVIFAIVYFSRDPFVNNTTQSIVANDKVIVFMGSIISSLLVVVGVFISKYFKLQAEAITELKTAINELSINSATSTKLLFAFGERMDSTDKLTEQHNVEFEKRFEDHKKACLRGFKSKE